MIANGWHAGLAFNTGIAKARLQDSRYGMELTGKCTEETLKICDCEDGKGNKKNEYLFSLD